MSGTDAGIRKEVPVEPAQRPVASAAQPPSETEISALNAYTEGKMKRYNLLFAVNGGAFALLTFLAGNPPISAQAVVVGGLNLRLLALGMSIFTVAMCFDIWKFGEMMRATYFGGERVFQTGGKLVLTLIGALLVGGWLLAAFG